jgi:carboxyl-terminal processing protease
VDGRDVRESTTDQAASLMQGLEGSRCVLEIQGKVRKQPRKVALTRRAVVVKSIPVAKILDGTNIGYIQMTGFQSSTAEELDLALRNLNSQGMRALIWDVRGNPGGLLQTAVQVLDRFIGDGVVVSTKGRASDQNHVYQAYRTGTWSLPLVLLVDGDSASASEIVAGAIRDHRRGTLVGRRTFGKWSVQSIYDLMGGGGLRITTAKFYSPSGKTYGKIGVDPHVVVELPKLEDSAEEYVVRDLATDPDVLKGIEVLRDTLASR